MVLIMPCWVFVKPRSFQLLLLKPLLLYNWQDTRTELERRFLPRSCNICIPLLRKWKHMPQTSPSLCHKLSFFFINIDTNTHTTFCIAVTFLRNATVNSILLFFHSTLLSSIDHPRSTRSQFSCLEGWSSLCSTRSWMASITSMPTGSSTETL